MKRQSLATQLRCYVLITLSLLLIAVSVGYYYTSSKTVVQLIQMNTRTAIVNSSQYISDYIQKLTYTATTLAQDQAILTYIQDGNDNNKDSGLQFMSRILKIDAQFVAATLITKDGRILSTDHQFNMTTSKDMMSQTWYQEAIQHQGIPVLSAAHQYSLSDKQSDWVISVTKEIVEHGENRAVLRLDINYQTIASYLKNLDLGQSGYAFIVDKNGYIVYHPEHDAYEDMSKQEHVKKLFDMQDGYEQSSDVFIQRQTIAQTDWTLVGVASADVLTAMDGQLLITTLTILVVALIVSGIGISLLIRHWQKPIVHLQETMSSIENGNKQVRANTDGALELHELATHFNRMLDNIDRLMKDVQKKEHDLRQFEMAALASQINPHFLYNTLDTIIWMAEFNDSQKVVALTQSLAQFFRLSLNQGNELTTLANELEHVRQYLFIQQQRYGEQLTYQVDSFAQAENIKIPKLILQPIVENAIYHGIKGLDRKGYIHVFVTEMSAHHRVTVYDNGKGMSPIMQDEDKKMRLGGIGIYNVNKRLSLYYGKTYYMQIDSIEHKETAIHFWLPKS